MTSLVSDINTEYFGKDRRKNYLKDDFSRVLCGMIQRDVILHVILECSKARHNEKRTTDSNGNESIAYGDFDPDNAGFLYSILDVYEKGLMVDVRQLLIHTEAGAGGKFIKDVASLTVDDFIDYYKHSKDGSVIVPHILIDKFIQNSKSDRRIKGPELIDHNRSDIENAATILVSKAIQFHSRNYFNQIVKDYQALKLHKDREPEKYDVREEVEAFGILTTRKSTRKDRAKVEISKIAEYLNGFAEIIALYQNLVSENTSFFGSNWPLETYVQRTFALFSKEVPANIQQKVLNDILTHLHGSLDVAGWDHSKVKAGSK